MKSIARRYSASEIAACLQEREFERVGDTSTITVDTRVIAASNRDLAQEVKEERFREDLYWRLNVVPIRFRHCVKRVEDIPDLVAFFLNHYSEANQRFVVHIQKEAIEAMQDYHWPGNVRELQNYVERAVVMADEDELTVDLLPLVVRSGGSSAGGGTVNLRGVDLETLTQEVVQQGIRAAEVEKAELHSFVVNRVEKELISQVLSSCNNVQTKAAGKLGINRNTLHKNSKSTARRSRE